jgi:glycosyltransferase involved in cell wall biosynthesis
MSMPGIMRPHQPETTSKPMRILHLITRLILGGAQENTILSCAGQVEAGHEVHLAFGPIYGPEGSLHHQAVQSGAQLMELSAMRRAINPLADWRAFRQCVSLIRRIEPDVVHTHSSKAGILGRLAAWKLGIPAVIHTIHGLPFHPYQSIWKNRLYIASERCAARRCHRIVSVADAMTRQALAAGIGHPKQYCTVYSGMDTQPFLDAPSQRPAVRSELGLSEEDIAIGTVARLAELKGHDDILDALAEPLRQRPNLKLLWVGDGWWRDRLSKRIGELGLKDHVVLTGLVPSERVPSMIGAMDLLVHPSYREGLPRAVPQALLAGVPVVAYAIDGAPEVCRDMQTGRLVEPGNTEALRDAVLWMIDHPAERRAMAEAGRAWCADRFSAQTMVSQLIALYEQILDEQGAGHG